MADQKLLPQASLQMNDRQERTPAKQSGTSRGPSDRSTRKGREITSTSYVLCGEAQQRDKVLRFISESTDRNLLLFSSHPSRF
jgi:outer membrane protein TolC